MYFYFILFHFYFISGFAEGADNGKNCEIINADRCWE